MVGGQGREATTSSSFQELIGQFCPFPKKTRFIKQFSQLLIWNIKLPGSSSTRVQRLQPLRERERAHDPDGKANLCCAADGAWQWKRSLCSCKDLLDNFGFVYISCDLMDTKQDLKCRSI
jgi:hypothetical protein